MDGALQRRTDNTNAGTGTAHAGARCAMNERRDRLTQWERALLDAHLAGSKGDMVGQYRAYSRVVQMTPGSEWNYKLAVVAFFLNRPQEAAELLTEVDPEQGWLSGWQSYWNFLSGSQHLLGQHEQELRDIRRGRRLLPENERLLGWEAGALGALGRVELPASTYYAQGRLRPLVEELFTHGHEDAAERLIADHLTRYDPGQDTSVYRAAYWLERVGQLEEAEATLDRAVEAGSDDKRLWARLAILAAKRGEREKALRISKQLEEREEERVVSRAYSTFYRATIAAYLGDNEGAMELLRQSREMSGILSRDHHWNRWIPQSLRDYPPFQELVRPKG